MDPSTKPAAMDTPPPLCRALTDLHFDINEFCQNLKATKPPYECPIPGCGKIYKSYSGIHFHIYNFDHDNMDMNAPSPVTSGRKPSNKKRGRWSNQHHRSSIRQSPTPPPSSFRGTATREPLTYAESQRIVEVDVDGKIYRINIYEPLDVITQDQMDNKSNLEIESNPVSRAGTPTSKNSDSNQSAAQFSVVKLPEAQYKVVEDFQMLKKMETRPAAYYRYIEKSVDELDEEVEYDMDEEDYAWLELMNEDRKGHNMQPVSQDEFETLMDRFEKEAFFQSQSSGKDHSPPIDEDAVCSICQDGECQNSNVILFCDMCNLAVHQECYGVPYIPEGQWLCRRCLHSPSRAVECHLCPNKGGAFKQTDDGRWCHVTCAFWIPEVGFANPVFLEPIDGISKIPPARWRLSCYICKQRGTGACIQCHKTNCYTAFHVTCAQQANLYMKIEPVRDPLKGHATVRKTSFCDFHSPAFTSDTGMFDEDDKDEKVTAKVKAKQAKSKIKMRRARKILAEKRNAMPVVSIPIIPEDRLCKISLLVSIQKKQQFLSRLLSYWTLKRQSRNGVPLLRRLQSNHMSRNKDQTSISYWMLKRQSRNGVPLLRRLQSNHMSRNKDQTKNDQQSSALRAQLMYWQRLRQDLEKARLLVELIRKREKLKREKLRLLELATEFKLRPFTVLLRHTLDQLHEKDTQHIFAQPVSLEEAPDYLDVIKSPMDLNTIAQKVDNHQYVDLDEFQKDVDLIWFNCLEYNPKDSTFYRAGVKFRENGGAVVRAARRMAERVGYDPETGLHLSTPPSGFPPDPVILDDIDDFMHKDLTPSMSLENQLKILLDKMDIANCVLKGVKRTKLAQMIRKKIYAVRKKLALQKGQDDVFDTDNTSMDSANEFTDSSPVQSPARPPKLSTSTPVSKPPVTPEPAQNSPGKSPPKSRTRSRSKNLRAGPDLDLPSEDDASNHSKENADTPSGVNRRTTVLFGKKSARKTSLTTDTTQKTDTETAEVVESDPPPSPKRRRLTKSRSSTDTKEVRESRESTAHTVEDEPESPTSPTHIPVTRKRATSTSAVTAPLPEPRSSRRVNSSPDHTLLDRAVTSPQINLEQESFKMYRTESALSMSETDDTNSEVSSSDDCYSDTSSDSSSSVSRDKGDNSDFSDDSSAYRRSAVRRRNRDDLEDVVPLDALDLVWAKCRGYPWYPALIINPKMPKSGFFHNGVPIPVPPDDVLELQRKYEEPVFLVLFFDTKRTWQWLPRAKLEPLGVDSGLDKAKLLENKKPNVRKAVRKAYEKAILHRCSVTGEPNPLSGDSSGED